MPPVVLLLCNKVAAMGRTGSLGRQLVRLAWWLIFSLPVAANRIRQARYHRRLEERAWKVRAWGLERRDVPVIVKTDSGLLMV